MYIRRDNDPFKKYWWVILLGCGLVVLWICYPYMEGGTGSQSVSRGESGLASLDQSLDNVNNPSGAPGDVVNLSMEGVGRYAKKDYSGPITSSLYQAPESNASSGTLVAVSSGAAGSSLAAALNAVAKKKDETGWGGEKARRGFASPKIAGGLPGLGGGGGGGAPSIGAFGGANSNPGVSLTRGLGSGSSSGPLGADKNKSLLALKSASAGGIAAAGAKSLDKSAAASAKSFDGGSAAKASLDSKSGSTFGGLDTSAAPVNLKTPDKAPDAGEGTKVPELKKDDDETKPELSERLKEMVINSVVGGFTNAAVSAAAAKIFGPPNTPNGAVGAGVATTVTDQAGRQYNVSSSYLTPK